MTTRFINADGWSQEKAWRIALKATALMLQDVESAGGEIRSVKIERDGDELTVVVDAISRGQIDQVVIKGEVSV